MTVFSFRRMTLVWLCPPPRQTGSRSWEARELPPQVCHPEISNMRGCVFNPYFQLAYSVISVQEVSNSLRYGESSATIPFG